MLSLLTTVALSAPAPSDGGAVDASEWDDVVDGPAFSEVSGPETRIINGQEGTRDEWPMAGGMLLTGELTFGGFSFEQSTILCSSTLIAPDVVLLAAHCLDLQALTLQLGGATIENPEFFFSRKKNLSDYILGAPPQNLPEDAVRAIDTASHGDFNLFTMQIGLAQNDDIALLFLETPILDTPLGYLPAIDTDETRMDIDDEVVVVGWGQQVATAQDQQPPPNSYGVKHQGISHIADKSPFEFKVGEIESDVRKCHGDSGGPSFREVETDSSETFRVIGVTSHAYDLSDCNETGGVDTRVSFYLDWIDAQMRERCEDGTRVWCEIEGIIPPPLADGTLAWEISEADPEEDAKKACGCSAGGLGAVGWLGLAAMALIRRS